MENMNEFKDIRYIKKIISEFNALLESWGPSESWDLNQFKTLENMIFETTKINVNANTLKRFFQQKTGNPQVATKDALCRFLGYSGYTDFVMKQTKKEEVPPLPLEETPEKAEPEGNLPSEQQPEKQPGKQPEQQPEEKEVPDPLKKKNKHYTSLAVGILVIISGYLLYTYKLKEVYVDYLISKIEFTASQVKGICPLTVTFTYHIPSLLFDDISVVYEEANGDVSYKKLNKDINKVNATYIYEGEGFCYLKYKDRTVRTINIEGRKAGWSVFVREERKKVFTVLPIEKAYNEQGYVTLPIEDVPEEARTNHMFVSYVFYKDKLVDGDNFIYEARVRNSAKEYAVPCSDIIMYIHSDTGMHGFAMNENGYAYIKFISGENTIKGDEYNLDRFNFNSSEWHVMSIKVENKHTTFYVDGEKVLDMDYTTPLGFANELTLRFKGCGAVDYVKVFDLEKTLLYEENFEKIP